MKIKLFVDARWGDKPEEFGEAGTEQNLTDEKAQRLLDAGLAESLEPGAADKPAKKSSGKAK